MFLKYKTKTQLTFAPPGPFGTDFLRFENEALGLDYVEEEFPHQVGRTRIGHLQACAEPEAMS